MPGCTDWLWCLPEVSLQGREPWERGAQGGLCRTALSGSHQIPWDGKSCGWAAHGSGRRLPNATWPPHRPLACGPGNGTMRACPTLLQGLLHCSSGWKSLPQGQVSNHRQVSPVGSQVPRHGGALGSVPGWVHVQALCLPTLVALACPVAVTDRAAPWHGDVPVGCRAQETKGPGSTQHS